MFVLLNRTRNQFEPPEDLRSLRSVYCIAAANRVQKLGLSPP